MMNRTLFDIGADLLRAYAAIEDIDPDDPTQGLFEGDPLAEFFATLHEEEAAKLDNYAALVKTLEMEATAAEAEAEQWAKKAEVRRERVRWLKARLLSHLIATGREKVHTASGRVIAVQANGGTVPLKLDCDGSIVDLVPDQFRRTVVVVDTDKVRKALEAGEVLDFARLGERGKHLRIK